MMGEPFSYNRTNMYSFEKNLTPDGKTLTNRKLIENILRDLSEGRDAVVANEPDGTITLLAKAYRSDKRMTLTVDGQTVKFGRKTLTLNPESTTDEQITATVGGRTVVTGLVSTTTSEDQTTVTTVGQTVTTGLEMTTDGRTMTPDGQTTEVLEGQGVTEDSRFLSLPVEETVGTCDVLTVDGQPMTPVAVEEASTAMEVDPLECSTSPAATEEAPLVVEVDPTECAMSSSFKSVEDVEPSFRSVTPLKVAPFTPTSPRRMFMSPVESIPSASVSGLGPKKSVTSEDGEDMGVVARSQRVAGRKQAVVVDDDVETLSSSSSSPIISVGKDPVTASSSSRTQRKGVKRSRDTRSRSKEDCKERKAEGNGEGVKKKGKGKKKDTRAKDTPEEADIEGEFGEPKGLVELVFEEMSSPVLGATIVEWADRIDEIRLKSKNLQGRLSGALKKCVAKIKEGTVLLIGRSEAVGDPDFLRMRNSELSSRLREAERENARLEEQLKRVSSMSPSPLRKRRAARALFGSDADQSAVVEPPMLRETRTMPSSIKDAFPPLPQRPPREVYVKGKNGVRMTSVVPDLSPPSILYEGSEGTETGTETFLTRRINALVVARDLEKERRQREHRRKEQVDPQDPRKGVGIEKDKGEDTDRKVRKGDGKIGPRIVSDVQLVPSYKERLKDEVSVTSAPEVEWTTIGGRRNGRDKPKPFVPNTRLDARAALRDAGVGVAGDRERHPPQPKQQPKVRVPKPPLFSAVTITGRSEGFSYAQAMKSAREQINLESLGIATTRVRKAINGGLLIEVLGEGSRAKAEELVSRLRGVLKETAAVACPTKKRELRIAGFDESVSAEEILEELCRTGGCAIADVKVGPIRTLNNGLGTVWVQLPVAAAAKLAEEGRVRLGWTLARVELLETRPLQCFRCWTYGHVQNTCRSVVDRREACFKCGQSGHMAAICKNPVHCALCHDAGLVASHRLGGPLCVAQNRQDG